MKYESPISYFSKEGKKKYQKILNILKPKHRSKK